MFDGCGLVLAGFGVFGFWCLATCEVGWVLLVVLLCFLGCWLRGLRLGGSDLI